MNKWLIIAGIAAGAWWLSKKNETEDSIVIDPNGNITVTLPARTNWVPTKSIPAKTGLEDIKTTRTDERFN